ncbi:MAG: sulfotransferase family protein [Salinivirgaceae bacterium]|nr:MAG: sulfotransferase family protein [Salinivirgaceae bacterium]
MAIKRIHIVGSGPRTGTTLLAELMKTCFDIDIYTSHENRLYKSPLKNGSVFLTKAPQDILLVEQALKMWKDLTILYMIRDPRDTIVSKHKKDPDRYWASLRYWKTYSEVGKKLMQHPRFITIRYEDLVHKPDEIQDLLEEKIPYLKKTKNFSNFHEESDISNESELALGGVREISTNSIGNWKNHLPRIKEQIRKHGSITKDLIEYKYEENDKWEEILNDVEDAEFESHYPEYFTKEEIRKRRRMNKFMFRWTIARHKDFPLAVKEFFIKYHFYTPKDK